ncbi:MAG: transglycosylase SLT domain-containing protein [Bacteroidaceae bacterium]|nr:transglycosylase SLT domain-containing protein [Bacteroidaceae bacterium]
MQLKFLYPLVLLIAFVITVTEGDAIFRGEVKGVYPVPPAPRITYVSPYVELSPYDHHFRAAADTLQWDWKLVAAIAFTESRFDSTATSEVGACGVMQVMPATLRGMGVPDSLHMDTRTNIMAAAGLLDYLDHLYRRIRNFDERANFILASYNAGAGHIGDAMNLAEKYGRPRYVWNENVDSFLILKGEPEFYTDSVCRNGSFSDWRQTLSFVKKVKRNWKRFERMQARYSDSIATIMAKDSTIRIKE